MNNDDLPRFFRHHLDAGLTTIGAETRNRLRNARQKALARHASTTARPVGSVLALAHIDSFFGRALLRAAVVLVFAIGGAYWHANRYIVELEEIDSAILTDEMPIDVITDKGFDAWLKSHKQY